MEFIDLLLSLASAVWRRFPLAVIVTSASIVVLLLLIAMLSRRRSARDEFDLGAGRADQRREPDLFGGYSPYSDDYRPEARRARGREASRRKRFGFFALSLAFLFGALVGFAGLGTAKRYDIAPAVVKAVERVETKIATFYAPPAPPSTEAAPTRAPQPKAQDRMEARNDAKRNDTTKLDTFIRELRAKLPTPVDRTTDLISVEEQANVVTLGFRVSELVPNLDAERFAASLQENIEANACKPSGNPGVRELNLDGVEFIFLYSDQADETLAEVRLPPGFCDNMG